MDAFVKPNFELWQRYVQDIPSPRNFLDIAFYFMIASALQRRVWVGNPACYPNIYVPLVAPPAVGKGIAIAPIVEILRYHKLRAKQTNGEITPDMMIEMARREAQIMGDPDFEELIDAKHKQKEDPLLFPIGANATTFEALTQTMAKATRRIGYKTLKADGKEETGIYTHCSLIFIIPELSSLIKERSENIVNFFTDVYDCKDPYVYETKHFGKDIIRRPCLNFIAGTTPEYMQDIFDESILNDGFASRAWFIYAPRAPFNSWDWTMKRAQNPELIKLFTHFVNLTKRLSLVYGEVKFTPEANDILRQYWEVDLFSGKGRKNKSPKLNYYYGRKNLHLMKLCMLLHFSEVAIAEDGQCNKLIEAPIAIEALRILENIEVSMHEALQFGAKNPLTKAANKILRYLVMRQDVGEYENYLKIEFWSELPPPVAESFQEVMAYLKASGQVESIDTQHGPKYKGPLWRVVDLVAEAEKGEVTKDVTEPSKT